MHGYDGGKKIKFQAEVDKDHKSLSLSIVGESRGNLSQVKTKLPLGKTLLLDLGACCGISP